MSSEPSDPAGVTNVVGPELVAEYSNADEVDPENVMELKRTRALVLMVLLSAISPIAVLPQELMFDTFSFRKLRSIDVFSANREYRLVIVPELSVEKYIENYKALRKNAGDSPAQISKELNRKGFRELVDTEREHRRSFPESGVYREADKLLIHRVTDFPEEIDRTFLSNDGSLIVGVNIQVVLTHINNRVSDAELFQTKQKALYSLRFGPNGFACSKDIPELIKPDDALLRTSAGFYWAQPDYKLHEMRNLVVIEKHDGSMIEIDLEKCSISVNSNEGSTASNSEPNNSWSSCLSFAIIPLALLLQSKIRR